MVVIFLVVVPFQAPHSGHGHHLVRLTCVVTPPAAVDSYADLLDRGFP